MLVGEHRSIFHTPEPMSVNVMLIRIVRVNLEWIDSYPDLLFVFLWACVVDCTHFILFLMVSHVSSLFLLINLNTLNVFVLSIFQWSKGCPAIVEETFICSVKDFFWSQADSNARISS